MKARPKLTSDLLVRKGQASPTGGFAHAGIDLGQRLPAPVKLDAPRADGTLGTGPLAGRDPHARAPRRPSGADQGRVALTLRLDRERHRRLKVFCARGQQTTQEVLLKALDAYLEACGADCACLRGDPETPTKN